MVYNIKNDDIYEWIIQITEHFTLSESVKDHMKYHTNRQVLRNFKDEATCLPIVDCIALSSMWIQGVDSETKQGVRWFNSDYVDTVSNDLWNRFL